MINVTFLLEFIAIGYYKTNSKRTVILPTCCPVINPHDILHLWIIQSGGRPTKMKVQQRNENFDTGSEI